MKLARPMLVKVYTHRLVAPARRFGCVLVRPALLVAVKLSVARRRRLPMLSGTTTVLKAHGAPVRKRYRSVFHDQLGCASRTKRLLGDTNERQSKSRVT